MPVTRFAVVYLGADREIANYLNTLSGFRRITIGYGNGAFLLVFFLALLTILSTPT